MITNVAKVAGLAEIIYELHIPKKSDLNNKIDML